MEYNDHADSISVEIEMRDIMRGEQPAHEHSMDDVNLLLDDGGGQVLGGCLSALPELMRLGAACAVSVTCWCDSVMSAVRHVVAIGPS